MMPPRDHLAEQFAAARKGVVDQLESIERHVQRERERVAELLASFETAGSGFREIKPYPSLNTRFDARGWGNQSSPEVYQKTLDDLLKQDETVREANEAAAAHNASIVKAAIEFCKRLGLPDYERVPVKKRGRTTVEHVPARWLTALRAVEPPSVSWQQVVTTRADRLRDLEEWRRAEVRVAEEKARKDAEERRKIEAEARKIAEQMAPPSPPPPPAPRPAPPVEHLRALVPEPKPLIVGGIVPEGERLEIE